MSPGEVLAFSVGPFTHYLIVSDRGTAIFSSFKDGRVVEIPLADAIAGHRVWSIGYPGTLSVHEVMSRARGKLNQSWAITDNCEHFYRYAHGLEPQSPQLRRGLAIGAVIGLIWLLTRA